MPVPDTRRNSDVVSRRRMEDLILVGDDALSLGEVERLVVLVDVRPGARVQFEEDGQQLDIAALRERLENHIAFEPLAPSRDSARPALDQSCSRAWGASSSSDQFSHRRADNRHVAIYVSLSRRG